MTEYISNELVHWTGRGKKDEEAALILKTICEEEVLRLSYCPQYVQPGMEHGSSMVCFTDIPLNLSREHCDRFGRCAIGFHKKQMIEYGANPVFYTTAKHLERVKHVENLLARMKDLEKDREWKEGEFEPYRFTEDETVALMEVVAFHQEYAYKNNDHGPNPTYYQREWRLPFNILPFAGDNKPHTPGMSCIYSRAGTTYPIFKFAPTDVAYLVVPEACQKAMADIAQVHSWEIKIFEQEVGP